MKLVSPNSWLCAMIALGGLVTASAQEVMVTGRVAVIDRVSPRSAGDDSNVVVWLTPLAGAAGRHVESQMQPTHQRLRLVQKHKRFDPHLLVIPAGSIVDFPNLDPLFHNVFSLFEGKRFDLGLYEAGGTRAVHFDRPGICYIFCNIHSEMSAVVVVLTTPYYGISDRAGEITIPSVPPGRYQLQVWNERSLPEALKGLTREVTVTEDARFLGTLRLSEASDLRLAHKNKYGRDYETPTPPGPLYEQP